jgi:hypothetical protein
MDRIRSGIKKLELSVADPDPHVLGPPPDPDPLVRLDSYYFVTIVPSKSTCTVISRIFFFN